MTGEIKHNNQNNQERLDTNTKEIDEVSGSDEETENQAYLKKLNDHVITKAPDQFSSSNIFEDKNNQARNAGLNTNVFGSATKITEVIKPNNGVLLHGDKV